MARIRRPSKQMLTLLETMSSRPLLWLHGYDMLKETGLGSGTVYPLLMRMIDQGLVEAEWRQPERPGRPARHVYRLTGAGLSLARAMEERETASSLKASLA
jgi:PadR family transcriptional regulator PadR